MNKIDELRPKIKAWINKKLFFSSGKRFSILTRKFIIFCVFVTLLIGLLLSGAMSPERITYDQDQLATVREFQNNSGEVKLLSETYSKDTGIVIMEFETSDYTSPIDRGISARKLEWSLSTISGNTDMVMEVIPLTNKKIDIIIKNVPVDYNLLSVRMKNHTITTGDVDVALENYDDYVSQKQQEEELKSKSSKDNEKRSNSTYFLATPQMKLFKKKYIKNVSREKFALQIFNDEKVFEQGQLKKLKTSISNLKSAIVEDQETLSDLEKEAQYQVGDKLVKTQDNIEKVNDSISEKQDNILTAKDNIIVVKSNIKQLVKNIKAVKDGTYEFLTPITSVSMKQEDVGK